MERCLIWYRLWMKVFIKKKSYWLQLAGMILLLMLIASVSLPDSQNIMVGICYNDGSYAEKVGHKLIDNNSVFDYKQYENADQLYDDIVSGNVECGFIFSDDFDTQIEKGNLKNSITYITTPLVAKGEIVKETVYSELLRIYSDEILKKSESDIYGNKDEERINKLLEQNHFFQEGSYVFQLEIEEVAITNQGGVIAEEGKTYPIQGMVGIIIFLIMFLAYGQKFDDKGSMVQKALNKREQFIYGYINTIAAGTLPAIVGIILIIFLADGNGRGIFVEILKMLLFLLISGAWIMIVGNLFRKSTTFAASIMSITIANLLICPVFMNFDMYVPAIKYVSLIFPLGIYLYL